MKKKKKIVFKNSIETKVFTLDEFFNKMVFKYFLESHIAKFLQNFNKNTRSCTMEKQLSARNNTKETFFSISTFDFIFQFEKKNGGDGKSFLK